MKNARRITLFLVLLALLVASATSAQTGGQLWIRLYQDLDGSGQRDVGEPLLTRGAAVSLSDSSGAVIATALLDESPNAAQGLIGFQNLPAGTYTATVTSADFAPSGEASFTREIDADGIPAVVEFGTQPIIDRLPEPAGVRGLFGLPIYLGERTQVARVALGILGASIVAAFMTLLGGATYWLVARRNRPAPLSPSTSGRLPVVPG
ncbi:MAG TPA: hypothetical protein VER79_13280 [Candidatus Limnocylindrales bacterium]|nr:hypothetical protein [Candidatus Limnocylindrales bacterium]